MFQEKLLTWYQANKRVLPWRENHDAYRIWLSEIMLQQTQVATVIDYFNRFIKHYPTVEELADADEDTVLKLWEGLGYYSRARRLIPCARMVVDVYGGNFPKTLKDILKLPGVGSYTAGAVLSIAYNIKLPAVDGNVMRVYSRLFELNYDISNSKSKGLFETKVMETLPEDRRHFNQALMELGATICTPKKPNCDHCPILEECLAKAHQTVLELPIKTKKIVKKHKKMVVSLVTFGQEIMIEKRGNEGLLAGMWGFPCYEINSDIEKTIKEQLYENYNLKIEKIENISEKKHVFTHLVWEMTFVKVFVDKRIEVEYPKTAWIDYETLDSYPLPTAFRKLLR